MKKLLQILAITTMVLSSFVVMDARVYAEAVCEIGFTGPNSENLCVSETTFECSVDNENDIVLINDNEQTTISGDALVEENTEGGTVATGSATNNNNVTFNVTITNDDEEQQICSVIATAPPTIIPEEEEEEPVVPPSEEKPTVLPTTSGDNTSEYLMIVASVLGAGSVVALLATVAYRRFNA